MTAIERAATFKLSQVLDSHLVLKTAMIVLFGEHFRTNCIAYRLQDLRFMNQESAPGFWTVSGTKFALKFAQNYHQVLGRK